MNITDIVGDKCTGCGACVVSCPTNAISIIEDKEGFEIPEITPSLCVDCNRCIECCHAVNKDFKDKTLKIEKVFYGWSNSEENRKRSSSGGIFVELAKSIITANGVVYGAVYDKELCKVVHTCDSTLDDIMRSKYVQSSTVKSFHEIVELLNKNKIVLFCGTPCQVAALHRIIGGNNRNLTTVDFICHGVPSPGIFKDYINMIEQKYKSSVKKVEFRLKIRDWSHVYLAILFKNGKVYIRPGEVDRYYRLFFDNILLRSSCYSCQYSNQPHLADITLADYWGARGTDVFDEKGVSLIHVNTDNGLKLINNLQKEISVYELPIKEAQYVFKKHDEKNGYDIKKRNLFFQVYESEGINVVMNKYCKVDNKTKYKNLIKTVISNILYSRKVFNNSK